MSTRIDEGSEYLRTRLGLSAEQFCQVVLLPQGDFARFLRAEPEDRGRLLRTLFDVGRFARGRGLAGRASGRRPASASTSVRHAMSNLLGRLAQVADVEIPEELAPELVGRAAPAAAPARWVARLRARGRRPAGRADAGRRGGRRADVAEVDAELAAARALADRHARRDRARAELEALAGAGGSSSRRCAPSGTTGGGPSRCATSSRPRAGRALAAEQAADALGRGRRGLGGGRPQGATADAPAGPRAARRGGRRCAPCCPRSTGPRSWPAQVARLDRARRRALAAAAPTADAARPRLARADRRARGARGRAPQEAAARLPGLRAQRDGRPRRARRRARPPSGSAAAARRRPHRRPGAPRERWLDARERWLDLRAQRLDGMAAELAAGLVRRRRLPGLRRRSSTPGRPRTTGPWSPRPTSRPPARWSTRPRAAHAAAAAAAVERQERELAALRGRRGRPARRRAAGASPSSTPCVAATGAEAALAAGGAAPRWTTSLAARDAPRGRALAADREELQARTAESRAVRAALDELHRPARRRPAGDDADLPRADRPADHRGRALRGGRRGRRPTSSGRGPAADTRPADRREAGRRGGVRRRARGRRARCSTPAGWPRSTGGSTSTTARSPWRSAALAEPSSPTSRPGPTSRRWEQRCADATAAARGRRRRARPRPPLLRRRSTRWPAR